MSGTKSVKNYTKWICFVILFCFINCQGISNEIIYPPTTDYFQKLSYNQEKFYTPNISKEFQRAKFNFYPETGKKVIFDTEEITTEDNLIQILEIEAFGTLIDKLEIYTEGEEKRHIKQDAQINVNISNTIYPLYFNSTNSYLQNTKDQGTEQTSGITCNYTNPGPTYITSSIDNQNLFSFVHLINKNFALQKNSFGIKVVKMNKFVLNITNLDDYILESNNFNKEGLTENRTFSKLYVVNQFYQNETKLAGLSDDGYLYIYNVTDVSFLFTVDYWTKVDIAPLTEEDITKVGIWGNQIIVSSLTQGLLFFNTYNNLEKKIISEYTMSQNIDMNIVDNSTGFNNTTKPLSYEGISNTSNITLSVKDFVINNSTMYVIIKDYGLVIYDFLNSNFTDFSFNHNYLLNLDYFFTDNFYYIGVSVDNSRSGTDEVLYELIVEIRNETAPIINKIVTLDKKVNWDNSLTSDYYLSATYLLDKINSKLSIFVRGAPNYLNLYSYIIDLSTEYSFDITNNTRTFMISEDDDAEVHSLVLEYNNIYYFFGRFKFPKNTLSCNFNRTNFYYMTFTTFQDCSSYVFTMNYESCRLTYNYALNVEVVDVSSNLSGLWIILGLLVIIAFIVIVYILFCKRRGQPLKQANYMQHPNRDAEMIEYQIDQK